MKIGISCYPVYGGSGVVATELGLELARRGHEVHFITYAPPFRLSHFVERIYYHEVEVPQYALFEHPPYNLALSVAIQNVAAKHELDLLHAHYAVPHATSAWLAKEMLGNQCFRIITTLHGTDITLVGQDPSYHAITQFSIRRSDGLTAVSDYLKHETVKPFADDDERIRVIPNFVDGELFGYQPKDPAQRKRILSIRPFASHIYANDLAVLAARQQVTSEGVVASGFDKWLEVAQAKGNFTGYDPDLAFDTLAGRLTSGERFALAEGR